MRAAASVSDSVVPSSGVGMQSPDQAPLYVSSRMVQSSLRGVSPQNPFTALNMFSKGLSALDAFLRPSSPKKSPLAFSASVTPSVTTNSLSAGPSLILSVEYCASDNNPTGRLQFVGRDTPFACTSTGGTCPQFKYSITPSSVMRQRKRVAYFCPATLRQRNAFAEATISFSGMLATSCE